MSDLPEKIGKYEVLGVAGRGAMGIVYVGHDPFIDRKVAIKVCTPDQDESSWEFARRMFFNEAKSAGALDHPNILRIYDAGEADGQPYIVMEFVDGGATLKEFATPDNLLPIGTAVRYFHQCARALDYAHRRDVLHRDIKPANIMLTPEGEAKIGDFGIAQRLQPDKTQLMSTFGSPRYMSPEQAREEPLTTQTDIYSFGVTMYELLTGKPPFVARGIAALVNRILHDEPPSLRELRPEIPEALEAIVLKAMAKKLGERYSTGGEIAHDLAALDEGLDRGEEIAELDDERKLALARGLAFFNEFSDAELDEVLAIAVWERHPAGSRIIEQGVTEQAFYVLVQGEVEIVVGDQRIARLAAGECFGELGYLTSVQRTASVVALDPVLCMKIDELVMDWASLSCQVRFGKVFQQTLIDRLAATTLELARCRRGDG